MSSPGQAVSSLSEVAAEQWGLITRQQLQDLGIPKASLQRLTQGSLLRRIATGVYQVTGAPMVTHLALRAAWLQLKPGTPVWQRTPDEGVVSHRSAASILNLGDLPADRHEFTLPHRKQTRRSDVRLHHRALENQYDNVEGLWVTTPPRIAADLLDDSESPESVARIIADAIRRDLCKPKGFIESLSPLSFRFDLGRSNGYAMLRWLLESIRDPDASKWLSN